MYKMAIFSDLHGNYPALVEMLKEIDKIGVDRIISLGDVISIGPHPNQCIELLNENNIDSVMGNHEEYLVMGLNQSNCPKGIGDGEIKHQEWVSSQISSESFQFIKTWQYDIDINIDSLALKFFHSPYTKKNNDFSHFFDTRIQNQNNFDKGFNPFSGDVFFFGHFHLPFDLNLRKRYINPGSVGCHPHGYAQFSTIEVNNKKLSVYNHQIPYDRDRVINDLINLNVPDHQFILKAFFGVRN